MWSKATIIIVTFIIKSTLLSIAKDAGLVGRWGDIRILVRHDDPVVWRRIITTSTWPTRLHKTWGVFMAYGASQDCSTLLNRCVGSNNSTWQWDRPYDDTLLNLCCSERPEFSLKSA